MQAQVSPWKNPNFKTFSVQNTNYIQLDSLAIIPETLQLKDSKGNLIPKEKYTFNSENNAITFLENQRIISIELYVNPQEKPRKIYSKDTTLIVENRYKPQWFDYKEIKPKNTNWLQGLDAQGSMVRGISFGNNQNASVQSSLDLKIKGKLSDEIGISAVLYDHNIPIESEGYTQNINEFEQFYIELFNANSSLKAGFVDVIQTDDFFANFSKKVMGLQLSTMLHHKNSQTKISATASLARGEFYRYQFVGIEGNQGPYKLRGKNNENFIVILPNSERVYSDGILLQQGEEKDYIINYQSGEITFTNHRVVTSNTRFIIEFQYTNRNYNRYFINSSVEHRSERFTISGNIFSESDNKNSSINQNLNDEQKQILSEAGNDKTLMRIASATETPYEIGKILYRKTTLSGEEIFEYSTDQNQTLYNVNFSYLGNNQGNYVLQSTGINGRIFQYVAPINNIPQGDYEPIIQLVAPEKLQVFSLNTSYKLNEKSDKNNIGFNVAMSKKDYNLFSNKDDENNTGLAARIFYNAAYQQKNWSIEPKITYSFIQKNFSIIDRIYQIEFAREFNKTEEFSNQNQHNVQLFLKNKIGENWFADYKIDFLDEDSLYQGIRNYIFTKYQKNNFKATAETSLLNTKNIQESTKFLRFKTSAEKKWKRWTFGADFSGENNIRTERSSGQKNALSFRWNQAETFAQFGDSLQFNILAKLYRRNDDSVRLGTMKNISVANGLILASQIFKKPEHSLSVITHFRTIHYNNETTNLGTENYLLGEIKWNKSFWNNGLTMNVNYGLQSASEAQRAFQYIRVTDGQGIYKWTDYNQNGIEELDEFEIAEFQDLANYIRVFVNTISYQKVNKNNFNASMYLQPQHIFNTNRDFWQRWQFRFSYNTIVSKLKNDDWAEFNPFVENTTAKNQSIITKLQYNRITQNVWETVLQYTQYNNTQTIFLGKESQNRFLYANTTKYKILKELQLISDVSLGKENANSQWFATKNYEIQHYLLSPSVAYYFSDKINAKAFFAYKSKENIQGIEKLSLKELGAECNAEFNKTIINAKISWIENTLNGSNYSLVSNQMMEGLKSGKNIVWNLLLQKQLTTFLFLNLSYQGRKSEETETIHIGNVQLKMVF